MENKLEQLNKEMKNIALSREDKDKIREGIFSYMERHPVRNEIQVRRHSRKSMMGWLSSGYPSLFNLTHTRTMALALIIVLFLGGGVSFAADRALPGDILYPVKTEVNEEVRSWVAFGAKSGAELEADLAEERLEEAEKLALKGELDDEKSTALLAKFILHANSAKSNLKKLEEENKSKAAYEASVRHESSLEIHSEILGGLLREHESLKNLKTEVDAYANDAALVRAKVQAAVVIDKKVNTDRVARGMETASENKIGEVERYIEKQASLSETAKVGASLRLDDAKAIYAEGELKLESGAYGEAYVLFQQAKEEAEEAKRSLKTKKNLNIDAAGKVEINSETRDEEVKAGGLSESGATTSAVGRGDLRLEVEKNSERENGKIRSEGELKIDIDL